jgi:xylan 1,4-beta-xylosidase
MYSSYTAASFARIWELAQKHRVNLEGVLSWSFEFEDQPWFAGYRQLATNGVNLPVLNVFRLFAQLGPERIEAVSNGQIPLDRIVAEGVATDTDVGVLATRSPNGNIAVLVWNYHDDDVAGPDAAVSLTLKGLKQNKTGHSATVWRVDERNGNAFSAWKRMGSPQSPNATQYKELEQASELVAQSVPTQSARGGATTLEVAVPRQGVALIVLARQ